MSTQTFKEFAEENPDLCAAKNWVEDHNFLSKLGIEIPNKADLPNGFVKHFPQDFIVEEVAQNGTQYTIDKETIDCADVDAEGETVFATMVKCNLSTFEALRQLAEALGCELFQIQYAGIKDQRAITAQRISFRKISKEAIENISLESVFLKDVVTGKGVLQPGSLWGNRFTLLIRTETSLHEEINKRAFVKQFEDVLNNGFYNFFYLQRFGAPRYINYKWGRDIALGKYKSAVHSILTETTDTELQFFSEIRKTLKGLGEDWVAMQSYVATHVPHDVFMYERQIIDHLVVSPEDYLGALQLMQQQVQLWVYAYSSLLHNQHLSFLVRTGKVLPDKLPVALSNRPEDTAMYKFLLERDAAWPPKWPSLREFPTIQRRSQSIRTKSEVKVHSVNVIDSGILLQFSLQKGEYATTFLSHLFNLLGGGLGAHDNAMSMADEAVLPVATREYFKTILEEITSA